MVVVVLFRVGFVAVVLASRSYPTHRCFHTEDVKLSLVFSETGTRPCSGDICFSCFSFSSELPASTRSAAACEEKK